MSVGMTKFEDRFRALFFYAQNNGFGGAFPTFWEADSQQGRVYGAWLLKKEAAEFRDILASDLGYPTSPEDRFRKLFFWAKNNGFGGAFPTFWEWDYGKGKVYGAWLLKKEAAEFRDIPASELGIPTSPEDRFRKLYDWAKKNGFYGAFPTFWEADTEKGKVYGAWLLKKDAAEFRDVPFYDLLKMLIRPGDIIYGFESWPGHIGIIIPKNGDFLIREAYPDNGVSEISLRDFCEGGGYHRNALKGKSGQNYTKVEIYRVSCDDNVAMEAAKRAMDIKGTYDFTYLTRSIEMIAGGGFTAGIAIPKILNDWRLDWDNDDIWYCSKLVYKAYRRANRDLYPKEKKCYNPFVAFLTGEYPYLKGDCPWWVIAPTDIINSKYVYPICRLK
jgi:hypothetical protein